jgi:archaellum component FlaC
MPGRKRNPAKGVGETPSDPLLPEITPGSQSPPLLPAVQETPAPAPPLGELAAEKPARKPRARKSAAPVPPPAPLVEPPVLVPSLPTALLDEVNEALRGVKDRSTEVQEQLRAMREELQGLAREASEVRKESRALKQELAANGDSAGPLHQIRMVREELQETLREAAEVKQRALVVKQELQSSENVLADLHQALQSTRQLREEVESAGKEIDQVKARSDSVNQELQATESSLQAVHHALDTLREELKREFREAGARFLSLGEGCKALEKEVLELQIRTEQIRPAAPESPMPITTVDEEAPPAIEAAAPEVIAPGVPGPVLEIPPPSSEDIPIESKKQLGITVNPLGVVVEVLPDTPAEKAGLHPGDVVLDIEGKPVATSEDLKSAIEQVADRDKVHLTVARGAEKEELTAHLAETSVS